MNGSWKRAAAASALCLGLAAFATAGAAQDRPSPAGPAGAAGQRAPGQRAPGQRGADRQKMFEEMRQRREQRMHDLLQIKPDQEAAFHTFLTAVAPPHREGKDGQRGPSAGPGREHGPWAKPKTTPERLDRMTARLARMQATIAATRTFYAALSPDQRKAFDALPMAGGRGHGHRGFRGHGGGGHHFEGPR
jgi:protein CpxP